MTEDSADTRAARAQAMDGERSVDHEFPAAPRLRYGPRDTEPAAIAVIAVGSPTTRAAMPASPVAGALSGALSVAAGPRRGRVLLVEDNEDNQIIYRTILEHVGHTVLLAGDGAEAVALVRAERPDVVLMDVSLPIMDGWEATERLQADPVTRDIPVIALTAHALDRDRARAHAVGCRAYLTKPVDPRAVLAVVADLLAARVEGTIAEGPAKTP